MKIQLLTFALVFSNSLFAQQQPPKLYAAASAAPPTVQEQERPPAHQIPPDGTAPGDGRVTSMEIKQQIQQNFKDDPALASSDIRVEVTDTVVMLSGRVETQRQHEIALGIAQSYTAERSILDKIEVQSGKK